MKQSNNISLFSSILIIVMLVFSFNEYQDVKEKKNWTVLNIQGKEKMEVEPDLISFNLTIEGNGPIEDEVLSSVKIKTDKVLLILKKNGITEEEIETSYLNSGSHNYYYQSEPLNQSKTYITNNISIKTNSIDGIENIFNDVSKIKNVQFNGLQYEIKNVEKIQDDLAAIATDNARKKAEKLSKSLKTKIKGIKSIQTEHNNFGIYPTFSTKDIAVSSSSGAEIQNPENNNIPIFKKKIEVQSVVYIEFFVH